MQSVEIDFIFVAGESTLTLVSDGAEISISNHWLNARFSDLVECFNLLLDGVESTSCRWQGPVQEGHFIDFVADPQGQVSIAVHEFRYAEGSEYSEIWSAERGASIFHAHVPLRDLTVVMAQALRRVRTTVVDAAGVIDEYRHPFPQAGFDRIEAKAARFGYAPEPVSAEYRSGGGCVR